jgi:hypothetical protein
LEDEIMRRKDIVIGATYKIKGGYGIVKPRRIIDAGACENPNPFAIVECENMTDDNSGVIVITYRRLGAFNKTQAERIK